MSNPAPAIKTNANGLQIFVVILLSIIGAGAFVLSFKTLRSMFEAGHQDASTSWIFPILIDGPILAATVAIFYLASFDKRYGAKTYSWFVLALFSAGSIILNASHVLLNGDNLRVGLPIAVVMSAAPPIALMFTIHLLAILIHSQKKKAGKTVKVLNAAGEAVIGTKKKTDAQVLAIVKQHINKGRAVTNQDMMKWTGATSVQSAAYQLRRLKNEHPDVFGISSGMVNESSVVTA